MNIKSIPGADLYELFEGGGEFWAGILQGGGLGSKSARIFKSSYLKISEGVLNPLPLPPWIRYCIPNCVTCFPLRFLAHL